jgi:uncharacterized protein
MLKENANGWRRTIGKLSLVVTEQCNLKCDYCYARLSKRWHHNHTMSIDIADNIIDKLVAQANRCELIQFFGGEPTLNIDIVEHIAREIERRYKSGELRVMPRLGIVTNGYFRHRDRIYDVLKRYNVETTISLDGPPAINDLLRLTNNGKSTYRTVTESIDKLLASGVSIAIETVYTAYHIAQQYSIIDCMKFAINHGINKLILQSAYPPASVTTNPLTDSTFEIYTMYYMQAVDWWFGSFIKNEKVFDIYFKDILKTMLCDPAPRPSGCPAGLTGYSIGPDGDIYPCQLLYGIPRLHLGNVTDNDFVLPCDPIGEIHTEFEECRVCFARHWCQPCAALNDFFGNMAHPPERECATRKAIILRIGQWAAELLELPWNEQTKILLEKIRTL